MPVPRRPILFFLVLLSLVSSAVGQRPGFSDLERKLSLFNTVFPQEKVYLHLDNTGYFRGETIWFAAYVVRSDGIRDDLGKTLYVELINPVGEVFERQKLRIEDGRTHGQIVLKDKPVPTGFYEIRAYTRYMTNWDAAGIFSRVIPIFSEIEGATSDERHREMTHLEVLKRKMVDEELTPDEKSSYEHALQTLSVCDTLSHPNRTPFLRSTAITSVRFYPEGGSLVLGLPSRVAFDLNESAHYSVPHSGHLLDSSGHVLAEVQTQHEGRSSFVCVPDGTPLYLQFGERRFLLPSAEEAGCVMGVNVLDSLRVSVEIAATSHYRHDTLGLSLLHNGQLLSFSPIVPSDEPVYKQFLRSDLPPGVHQLTLFTPAGRILSERLFFIAPREEDLLRVSVTMPDTVSPYGKILLTLHGEPGASFSLSVQDYERRLAPCNGPGIASWYLLTSDLKGYIRNAEYYIEVDDPEHRQAADLLMLVQGWRRYSWQQLSGMIPFEKNQPVEEGLYLDGRVYADHQPVAGAELAVILLKDGTKPIVRDAVTDSAGYYAIGFPDGLQGEWKASLQTQSGGKPLASIVTIDRHFSPNQKELSLFETDLTRHSPERFFTPVFHPFDSLQLPKSTFCENILPEAVVKRKRKKKEYTRTVRDLEREKELLGTNDIYYDVAKEADEYADRGLPVPTLREWAEQKGYIRQGMDSGREIGVENLGEDPFETIPFDVELSGNDSRMLNMFGRSVSEVPIVVAAGSDVLNRRALPHPWRQPLTQFRSVYVDMIPADTIIFDFKRKIVGLGTRLAASHSISKIEYEELKNGIGVLFFQRYMFHDQRKGIRRTYYLGYNVAQTFESPDYGILPLSPDYRRTLCWNPDVTFNTSGEATIEFYNNSTCKTLSVSVEGIDNSQTPIILIE